MRPRRLERRRGARAPRPRLPEPQLGLGLGRVPGVAVERDLGQLGLELGVPGLQQGHRVGLAQERRARDQGRAQQRVDGGLGEPRVGPRAVLATDPQPQAQQLPPRHGALELKGHRRGDPPVSLPPSAARRDRPAHRHARLVAPVVDHFRVREPAPAASSTATESVGGECDS